MARINGRSKGAAGEREFANKLFELTGVKLERKLDQTRGGGFDLQVEKSQMGAVADALRGMAIECKRYGRVTNGLMSGFWEQALRQAEKDKLLPVLAYREDNCQWRVVVPMTFVQPELPYWDQLEMTVEMSIGAFATFLRETNEIEAAT